MKRGVPKEECVGRIISDETTGDQLHRYSWQEQIDQGRALCSLDSKKHVLKLSYAYGRFSINVR